MYNGYGFNEKTKAYAEINLSAIRKNYDFIKSKLAPECRIMAVLKADAYGHGAQKIAMKLASLGADAFAVAHVDEAVLLRRAGITGLILVLGYTLPECFDMLTEYDISQACASLEYLELLSDYSKSNDKRLKLHLKLNTGMNRTGFATEGELTKELERAVDIFEESPLLEREGIFSHFASSDETDNDFSKLQGERFIGCVSKLEEKGIAFEIKHLCNSSGILNFPEYHLDMVRLGLGLYGYCTPQPPELEPVMNYVASVVAINDLKKGDSVSYNLQYTAQRDMSVAVVCAGYADGVRRSLSNKGYFLCHGRKCRILGRVCMDMTIIDVTEIKDKVRVGDRAVLFGHNDGAFVGADEIASLSDTISYEILCGVGIRFDRVYKDDE